MDTRHSRSPRLFRVFRQRRRNRRSKRDGKRVAFTPGGSSDIYRAPATAQSMVAGIKGPLRRLGSARLIDDVMSALWPKAAILECLLWRRSWGISGRRPADQGDV